MIFRKHWLKMALLFTLAAVIGFVIPSTVAYFVTQSNQVVNLFDAPHFTPGDGGAHVLIQKRITAMGDKTISPEGFQFLLENADDPAENYTLTANGMGQANMSIFFGEMDVGKKFHYTLREINDARPGVVYSEIIYDIIIIPSVNTDNKVYPIITINEMPASIISVEFENIYNPALIPETGDSAPLWLFAGLFVISALGMGMLLKKRRVAQ